MKINEKLTKPITEVNYLRAENVDRYRVIIRFLTYNNMRKFSTGYIKKMCLRL